MKVSNKALFFSIFIFSFTGCFQFLAAEPVTFHIIYLKDADNPQGVEFGEETTETLEVENPTEKSLNDLKVLLSKKLGGSLAEGSMLFNYEMPQQPEGCKDKFALLYKGMDPEQPIGQTIDLTQPLVIQYCGYCQNRQLTFITPDNKRRHVAYVPRIYVDLSRKQILLEGEFSRKVYKRIESLSQDSGEKNKVEKLYGYDQNKNSYSHYPPSLPPFGTADSHFGFGVNVEPAPEFQQEVKAQRNSEKFLYEAAHKLLEIKKGLAEPVEYSLYNIFIQGLNVIGVDYFDFETSHLSEYDRDHTYARIKNETLTCVERASTQLKQMDAAGREKLINDFMQGYVFGEASNFFESLKQELQDGSTPVQMAVQYAYVQKYLGISEQYHSAAKEAFELIQQAAKQQNLADKLPTDFHAPTLAKSSKNEETNETRNKNQAPPIDNSTAHQITDSNTWLPSITGVGAVGILIGATYGALRHTELGQRFLYETLKMRTKLPTISAQLIAQIDALKQIKQGRSFDDPDFIENAWKILRQYNDDARQTLEQEAFGQVMNIMPARLSGK